VISDHLIWHCMRWGDGAQGAIAGFMGRQRIASRLSGRTSASPEPCDTFRLACEVNGPE